MNTKMAGILAGSILALMALAPSAFAHDNGTSGIEPSGRYYGAAGPWVQFVAASVDADGTGPAPAIDPSFTLALGNALCDMEVLSDGSANGADGDELHIDTNGFGSGMDPTGTTSLPNGGDGFFDDGGQGAVCHTPSTQYLNQDFNTMSCNYLTADGDDDNAPDVWVSTSCDYRSTVVSEDDPSPLDPVLGLPSCVINAVISADLTDVPAGEVAMVGEIAGCVGAVVTWAGTVNTDCFVVLPGNTDTCPAGAGGYACGADGTADLGNSGPGSLGVLYPTVPNPASPQCDDGHGVAAAFAWDAVVIDSVTPTNSAVYLATVGTIN